ncbi:ABC transporter permease [Spiroplasma endosymbiont of Othius punctulatus]|uniref:ABC transporter permease n=1 Tax=Spiroplasma endosymbiont of Othius punctulatus TaxID=3066289 RepID=UPI0030D05E3A
MLNSLFGNISIFFAIFLLASLAGMIAERAGMVNIAIEGYMIIGALVFSVFGFYANKNGNNNGLQIIGMLLAMVAAAVFSLLHSFASIKMRSNHIVSGTAINILAAGLGLFFITVIDGSDFVASNFTRMWISDAKFFNVYLLLAVLIMVIVGVYFAFTKTGMRHAACGENPHSVSAAGINVIKYRFIAMTVSAAIAGLAGAMFVVGRTAGIFRGDTGGWGFLALGIMIVGQWRTKFILISSFVFATLFGIGEAVGTTFLIGTWFADNKMLIQALPYIISLVVMVAMAKWCKPPKVAGEAFDKSKR